MRVQEILRKTFGLLTEEQIAVIVVLGFGMAPGCFCGKAPHFGHIISGKEVLQILVVENLHHMPVIKTGPADSLLGDVKTQRTDQMKPAAGGGAGAGDIAAVLGDLRFHQYNIQHLFHLGFGVVNGNAENPSVVYCMPIRL
jgi:hypothetical protein